MLKTIPFYKYVDLIRLDKPIGILLLLWPTLWGLWLAGEGKPHGKIVVVFMLGTVLMRSAGCILNDIIDHKFDRQVKRTKQRPLARGSLSKKNAFFFAMFLSLTAFILVLFCNLLTIKFAFLGMGFAIIYPFLKRITHLPQLGLGVAYTWGIPMAFAAESGGVPFSAWCLFATGIIWPVIYDTLYAMVDREDDVKIGVKSTAILFARQDKWIIACLQMLFVGLLIIVGMLFRLQSIYFTSIFIVAVLFIYQQWLIKDRDPQNCFRAFLNNNWVGMTIFVGIAFHYLFMRGVSS